MTHEPRIYVACLAAYNNGVLHGEWIDANQDAADIHERIQEMLAKSPIEGAEEFAIHDYDEFSSYAIQEYDTVEYVSVIGQSIADHGDAMAAWLENERPINADEATERAGQFEEAYAGEWGSIEEYAENLADDIGAIDGDAKWPMMYIDWERAARDLVLGGDVWTVDSIGGVYVFNGNV